MPAKASDGRVRRLVPRHRFTAAQDALKRARVAWTADAVHDHHAVLIATCAKGAAVLERFDARPANGVKAPNRAPDRLEPKAGKRAWKNSVMAEESDPLEAAFRAYAERVRAGEAPPL